jgi:hypothetical protein
MLTSFAPAIEPNSGLLNKKIVVIKTGLSDLDEGMQNNPQI